MPDDPPQVPDEPHPPQSDPAPESTDAALSADPETDEPLKLTPYQIELESRIEFCRRLLARAIKKGGIDKCDMKAQVMKRFDVTARTYETYMREARKRYKASLDASEDELRSESVGFYAGVVSDEQARMSDRLRARERLDKLLGLERPIKMEHGGTVGVQHASMVEAAAEMRRLLFERGETDAAGPEPVGANRIPPSTNGNGHHHANGSDALDAG